MKKFDCPEAEKIKEILLREKSFVIVTHTNPDIDGISSLLAMALVLKEMGKEVVGIMESPPEKIEFLRGREVLKFVKGEPKVPSLNEGFWTIVVDTAEFKRLEEEVRPLLKVSKGFLIFDHHQPGEKAGFSGEVFSLIDPEASSTTELLYQFFRWCGWEISPAAVHNLLAGIYYDTGGFRYENVTPLTFRVAAELVELGASASEIARNLFENTPLVQVKLLKLVIERMELLCEGRVALSYITKEDLVSLGNPKYISDFASFMRAIEGVELSALVKEFEKGLIGVSLRSSPPVEVVPLARQFGGGGHRYASGFKAEKQELLPFLEKFKKELIAYYERHKKA